MRTRTGWGVGANFPEDVLCQPKVYGAYMRVKRNNRRYFGFREKRKKEKIRDLIRRKSKKLTQQ